MKKYLNKNSLKNEEKKYFRKFIKSTNIQKGKEKRPHFYGYRQIIICFQKIMNNLDSDKKIKMITPKKNVQNYEDLLFFKMKKEINNFQEKEIANKNIIN